MTICASGFHTFTPLDSNAPHRLRRLRPRPVPPHRSPMPTLGQLRREQRPVLGIPLHTDTATDTEIRLRSRSDRIIVRVEKLIGKRAIRHRDPVTVHPLTVRPGEIRNNTSPRMFNHSRSSSVRASAHPFTPNADRHRTNRYVGSLPMLELVRPAIATMLFSPPAACRWRSKSRDTSSVSHLARPYSSKVRADQALRRVGLFGGSGATSPRSGPLQHAGTGCHSGKGGPARRRPRRISEHLPSQFCPAHSGFAGLSQSTVSQTTTWRSLHVYDGQTGGDRPPRKVGAAGSPNTSPRSRRYSTSRAAELR